jgi:aspartate carbamoyltransferase catalytic subunit
VALSNIYCLNKLGAKVVVAGPPTLIPKHIESLGVNVTYNVDEALAWCDVAIVLRIQLERQKVPLFSSLREYALLYGVNTKRLEKAKKDILIMHPGPINRGVEIDSNVADGPHSIILNQVENGVAIRMACLYLLAGKTESLG